MLDGGGYFSNGYIWLTAGKTVPAGSLYVYTSCPLTGWAAGFTAPKRWLPGVTAAIFISVKSIPNGTQNAKGQGRNHELQAE